MKSIFLSLLLLTSSLSFALTDEQLINTLEDALRFQGYVEIESVTQDGELTNVEFYVGSYGEERLTSCVLKNDKLVSCKDNWFKF